MNILQARQRLVQPEPKKEQKTAAPPFAGVKKAVLCSASVPHVTVELTAQDRMGGRTYMVPYRKGTTVAGYLGLMSMKHYAIRLAVYDKTNLQKGRVRMRYVPKEGAHLFLCPRSMGPKTHLQRGSGDRPTTQQEREIEIPL